MGSDQGIKDMGKRKKITQGKKKFGNWCNHLHKGIIKNKNTFLARIHWAAAVHTVVIHYEMCSSEVPRHFPRVVRLAKKIVRPNNHLKVPR
jgi:hypothetical protein